MKRIIATILSLIMILSISIPSKAQVPFTTNSEAEYLGNGLYGIVTYETSDDISTYATSTKTTSKKYTIQNADGENLARFTLKATFSYDGTTSKCTSSSYTTEVFKDSWSFSEASATKSGNTATGSFKAKCVVLFITTQTVEKTITLTCDKNGNIT